MSVCNWKIVFSIDPIRADIMKDITVNFVLTRSSGLYIQGQEKGDKGVKALLNA